MYLPFFLSAARYYCFFPLHLTRDMRIIQELYTPVSSAKGYGEKMLFGVVRRCVMCETRFIHLRENVVEQERDILVE